MIKTALFVALFGASVLAQQQAPEQQIGQLQQALSQRMAQLGACNAELGGYQQRIAAGALVTLEQVKSAFEQANPGKTFDAGLKVRGLPPVEAPQK